MNEGDHQVDLFFPCYTANTKHGRHVNNANASDFHEVSCGFIARADNMLIINQGDFGDIIRDEAVPSFDQCQDGLTLPNTAFASDKNPDA